MSKVMSKVMLSRSKKLASMMTHFSFVRDTLPLGAVLRGFRTETYVPANPADPAVTPVREMLADLTWSKGTTGEYFDALHEKLLSADADRHLVFTAIDRAHAQSLFPIAINVALESALNHKFIAHVLSHLHNLNVDPSQVTLELTERNIPGYSNDLSALTYARQKGLKLALDDWLPGADKQREEILGPHCDFFKIDKSAAHGFVKGKRPDLPALILAAQETYDVKIIVEGVRPGFPSEYPGLNVYATQKRTLQETSPASSQPQVVCP